MEFHRQCLVLFVCITAVTSRNFPDELSREDAKIIQEIVGEMQHQDADNGHHHDNDHGKAHHVDDHDYTNIQTLNLVFKHNNIGRSHPIASIDAGDDPQAAAFNDVLCKFGGKCNGGLVNDNFVLLDKNMDNTNAIYNVNPLDRNYYANNINYMNAKENLIDGNENIEKLLDDFEKALVVKNEDNTREPNESSNKIKIRCKGSKCDVLNPYGDSNSDHEDEDRFDEFLKDLEIALKSGKSNDEVQRCGCSNGGGRAAADDNDDGEINEVTGLRCACLNKNKKTCCDYYKKKTCSSCRAGDRDDSDEKDKSFLRCCRKCANVQYYRTSDGSPIGDDEERDDSAYLRCCKQCGRSEHFRTVILGIDDSQEEYDPNGDRIVDGVDSGLELPDRAKVYPINGDLDAIVIDASELDSILNLANIGNNLASDDSIKDYLRGGKDILKPVIGQIAIPRKKTQNRMLPLTQKQKLKQMKIRKNLRS